MSIQICSCHAAALGESRMWSSTKSRQVFLPAERVHGRHGSVSGRRVPNFVLAHHRIEPLTIAIGVGTSHERAAIT